MLIVSKSITIGDRLIWRHRDLRGLDPETGNFVTFDPAIYQLSWSFRAVGSINGDSSLDVIATNDNGEFLTIVDSTNLLGAGTYYYQAYITKMPLLPILTAAINWKRIWRLLTRQFER